MGEVGQLTISKIGSVSDIPWTEEFTSSIGYLGLYLNSVSISMASQADYYIYDTSTHRAQHTINPRSNIQP